MSDTKDILRVAAIQLVSMDDVAANLDTADQLIAEAADRGAGLIVLPENFAFLGRHAADYTAVGETEDGSGPIQSFLARKAATHHIWLIGGSVPLAPPDRDIEPKRVIPSCLVYSPDGERQARYDKIHLFDVGMPGSKEAYRESAMFIPGPLTPQVVETAVGRIGLSICYDLRFPELYRALADAGAELVVAPSAFTETTGQAHWHVLVRARAIENQLPVIAPGQAGIHAHGRQTYGHSLIVDAWGRILAEASTDEPEVVMADLDRAHLPALRSRFPALGHRRLNAFETRTAYTDPEKRVSDH